MKTIGLDISVLVEEKKTGVGIYTYELINSLLTQNKKDRFILYGLSPFRAYGNLTNLEWLKYPNVELKAYKLPARLFRNIFLVWQKLNRPYIENLIGEIDIFHTFNWYIPPIRNTKLVTTVFDLTPILFPQWHQDETVQLDKIRLQRAAKYSDLIISISNITKNDFLKYYPNQKVEVIYPGISNQFLNNHVSKKVKNILTKYKITKKYYLSVATLEPRKNIKFLIEAYLTLKQEFPLVLVGSEGWKNKEIIQLAEQNRGKIILTGYVPNDDLSILYSHAVCMIYPSFYEGFGIPIIEAMSCGVPVICSKTSSMPEAGGDAAFYIDPYDKASIAHAIKDLTINTKLRKEMILKGYKQVKKFSWDKSARKLNNIYQGL